MGSDTINDKKEINLVLPVFLFVVYRKQSQAKSNQNRKQSMCREDSHNPRLTLTKTHIF